MPTSTKAISGGWLIILANLLGLALVVALGFLLREELIRNQEMMGELARLEAQIEQVDENRELLEVAKDDQSKIDAYFVDARTLPLLIEELERMATTTGVSLDLTQAWVGEEGAPRLRLGIEIVGTFAKVTQFLSFLEVAPYEFSFGQLDLNRGGAEGGERLWRASGTLELLSYRNEKD